MIFSSNICSPFLHSLNFLFDDIVVAVPLAITPETEIKPIWTQTIQLNEEHLNINPVSLDWVNRYNLILPSIICFAKILEFSISRLFT